MKILHLDDHNLFTEGLSSVLLTHGINVTSASDTKAAIELLETTQDFDLIIADLSLPGLDGFAFIQSVEQRQLLLPIVVLSATEDLWLIKKSLAAGAVGFIPKTYKTLEIVAAINLIIAGEVYLPEKIRTSLSQLPDDEPQDSIIKKLSAYQLSRRQLDVLRLMHKGHSNEEIATILHVSINTIKTHVKILFSAFSVSNRMECVRFAEKVNLI
ncbi:Transcriptional activator protein ExaE [BD1-7 clade bacterium]|uniref:Transcriptional activator protein ExaE n=1 Tax=BD1-7 clade bacterium TaxID=2029982 RepID=A0A5S9PHI9_9GAMM|nr:Transcriptional activator protein ExaE [BD1-7 clade bacterium]